MMEQLRNSRWVYILLSLVLAIVFWMYVRIEVDPEDSTTIHNVPVELTGTNVLTGQGLTVTGISAETVDLRVSATVSVINNLIRYRDDIYIPLDVSRCTEGENRLAYQPKWPENFSAPTPMTYKGTAPAECPSLAQFRCANRFIIPTATMASGSSLL